MFTQVSTPVMYQTLSLPMWCHSFREAQSWLSQANHVFTHLQITSNFQHYAYVFHVDFEITISVVEDGPTGHLFLRPTKDFPVGCASVYAGLRQFHQGKGFDPDSLDLARRLGLPHYVLSAEMDPPPFAHVVEAEDSGSEEDNQTKAFKLHDDIPPMLFLV
ncbi:hypothetical protein B0H13DRAFT_1927172 [Mycena leptocephala]|nr:hypothetical protein B0H13DRAFT_1927172 [Mycena leptocephala]